MSGKVVVNEDRFGTEAEMEAAMARQVQFREHLKSEWARRGEVSYHERKALRAATHSSWRQMKGIQRVMFEMNHPGNKPFLIGFA